MSDLMKPLPRVAIGLTTFFVDAERPVAMVRRPGVSDRFITWPDLPTGIHSPEVRIHPAADALWVCYTSHDEGGDERYPALGSPPQLAAVRIGIDGSTGYIHAEHVTFLGVDAQGLWTGTSLHQPTDDNYTGGPLPESHAHPETLLRHQPGHPPLRIEFDRHVDLVRQTGQGTELWLNPSPPITHPDGAGGAGYEYRCTKVLLPPVHTPGGRLRFRDLVPEGWGQAVGADEFEALEGQYPDASERDPERIDLTGVPGTGWDLVALTNEQREQAIAAMAGQFAHLEAYWHGGTDGPQPLARGLGHAAVQVTGDWPLSRIEITFTHPHYLRGRMRRTIQVFDTAGRIRFNPYADIHLMEDLDTCSLPDPDQARDGILQI